MKTLLLYGRYLKFSGFASDCFRKSGIYRASFLNILNIIGLFLLILTVTPVWAQKYTEQDIANRQKTAFPTARLHRDWMYQDAGTLKVDSCFKDTKSATVESKMIAKALAELKDEYEYNTSAYQKRFNDLSTAKKPGSDPAWKDLYLQICNTRRIERLKYFEDQPREFIYAKHFVFGDCQAMFAMTDHLTDAVFRETGRDYRMNSQLCKTRINSDGTVSTEVLFDCPTGIVRDPSLSYNGENLLFSMRKTDQNGGDDFHLYVMALKSKKVKQLTFGPGTADMEPEWLPNNDIVFTSTRCVFSAPCWWSSVCNLYTCDSEGRYIRRLGTDHGHTVFPHMTGDGRITYTRWEYSDRTAGYLHSLFIMNPDGTNQTEFYGNNSQYPGAYLHARSVPNSTKVIAIAGAHHIDQRGKLIMIDRREGTQAGDGIYYLAPERKMPNTEGQKTNGSNVVHGTEGEQFQYPYPLDEDNYVVCYSPEGGAVRGLKGIHNGKQGAPAFGIYWMNRDGARELLIYDPVVSSGQQIPLAKRELPPMRTGSVDEHKKSGLFYIQNVYFGQAAEGIKPGSVKKMRIVALDYRAKGTVALGLHPWGGHQTSPCGINNTSYDVKHVLGTVEVESDGSCYFECPSRVPVFFQLLNEKGEMIQNMRSWTQVLPGETFSCFGCHENKNSTITNTEQSASAAARKAPQKIKPFFKSNDVPVQEMQRFLTETEKRALKWLGPNAPQGMDVPTGFSYTREVQPIWDQHCIQCHAGSKNPDKKIVPLNLLGDERPISNNEIYDRVKWRLAFRNYGHEFTQGTPGRKFSESYINLTDFGFNAKIPKSNIADIANAKQDSVYLSWFGGDWKKVPEPNRDGYSSLEYSGNGIINWLHVSSLCAMLPPYSYGSISSRLMKYLEPSHYGVKLTPEEKENVACWIDLNAPFTGSWMELNQWDQLVHNVHSGLTPWYDCRDKMRQAYLYFEMKRLRGAELEVAWRDIYLDHLDKKTDYQPDDMPQYDFGGLKARQKFIDDLDALPNTVPIFGLAEGKNARGGSNVKGNPVRNLAINQDAYTHHLRSYPRIETNSYYRYKTEFSPIHLLDGKTGTNSYWRPARRTDAEVTVQLGRNTLIEKIVLTLHLTKDQKKTWTSAVLEFSNGDRLPIHFRLTSKPQTFVFPKKTASWVRLSGLNEAFPLTDNGLDEFEIWGTDLN